MRGTDKQTDKLDHLKYEAWMREYRHKYFMFHEIQLRVLQITYNTAVNQKKMVCKVSSNFCLWTSDIL